MTRLALEIFAVIFVTIIIACSDKCSKFNNFSCTLGTVLDLCVIGGSNFSLTNEGNIFGEFLFSCF